MLGIWVGSGGWNPRWPHLGTCVLALTHPFPYSAHTAEHQLMHEQAWGQGRCRWSAERDETGSSVQAGSHSTGAVGWHRQAAEQGGFPRGDIPAGVKPRRRREGCGKRGPGDPSPSPTPPPPRACGEQQLRSPPGLSCLPTGPAHRTTSHLAQRVEGALRGRCGREGDSPTGWHPGV